MRASHLHAIAAAANLAATQLPAAHMVEGVEQVEARHVQRVHLPASGGGSQASTDGQTAAERVGCQIPPKQAKTLNMLGCRTYRCKQNAQQPARLT